MDFENMDFENMNLENMDFENMVSENMHHGDEHAFARSLREMTDEQLEEYIRNMPPCTMSFSMTDIVVAGMADWKNWSLSEDFIFSENTYRFTEKVNNEDVQMFEMNPEKTTLKMNLNIFKDKEAEHYKDHGLETIFQIDHMKVMKIPYEIMKMAHIEMAVQQFMDYMIMNPLMTFDGEAHWKILLKSMLNYDYFYNMTMEHQAQMMEDIKAANCGKTLLTIMHDHGISIQSPTIIDLH